MDERQGRKGSAWGNSTPTPPRGGFGKSRVLAHAKTAGLLII